MRTACAPSLTRHLSPEKLAQLISFTFLMPNKRPLKILHGISWVSWTRQDTSVIPNLSLPTRRVSQYSKLNHRSPQPCDTVFPNLGAVLFQPMLRSSAELQHIPPMMFKDMHSLATGYLVYRVDLSQGRRERERVRKSSLTCTSKFLVGGKNCPHGLIGV